MDYVLSEQERLQSRVRRYQSPDEYPFFPDVVETPILQPLPVSYTHLTLPTSDLV